MTKYWRTILAHASLILSVHTCTADEPGGPPGMPAGSAPGLGAPTVAPTIPAGREGEAKKINLDSLKQKYWGNVSAGQPLRVVQNRAFAKAKRWNLGISGGTMSNDPFLNTYTYGANVGYNFSEYIGFHINYIKVANSFSSAYSALVSAQGFGSNSNPVSSILGGQMKWSVLYGKLSLAGVAIIHFDLYGLIGIASLSTQNGKSIAPYLGVGQQMFLSHSISLSFDYRMYRYHENIIELFNQNSKGSILGGRTTYAGAFTLGLNLFLF